jgi:hypothetical protein
MERSIGLALLAICVPLALDYYVFRNWRRFAKPRPRFRWTLPVYRVLMVLLPLTMPLYFLFSRWWDVDPKLLRAVVVGAWLVYYIPKLVIAGVLVLKDGARFVSWLFGWFQQRLHQPSDEEELDLTDMKRTSRRDFLQKVGWSAATVPYVLVGYSVFRTLYDFEVFRIDVPVAGLPRPLDGLTIGQLSDLHAGSFFSQRPMEEAVATVQAMRPDVIMVTGDYVNHDAAEMAVVMPSLRRLEADLGVYGCLGNHDHYARIDDVIRQVRDTPVDLLVNENRSLAIDGARLDLIGVDNTGFYQHFADMPRALDGLDPESEAFRILLAHTPTYWDDYVRANHPNIDLMLSGHTHGGQIGFEIGPLRYSLARVAYPRWAGLYSETRADRQGQQFLYVNRGVGTVGPPLRLGIRPEITLLTLRKA